MRIAHAHLSNLIEGRRAAVIVDANLVEQTRACAARTDAREIVAKLLNSYAHLMLGLLDDIGSSHESFS